MNQVGFGAVAQLVERLNGIQEVRGSIPLRSMPSYTPSRRFPLRGFFVGARTLLSYSMPSTPSIVPQAGPARRRLERYARQSLGFVVLACASAVISACHRSVVRQSVTVGSLTISNPYLVAPAGDAPAVMYFTIQNGGETPDTLTHIQVAGATSAELHREVADSMHAIGAMTNMTMVPMPVAEIPAHGWLRLAPGGVHVMVMGMAGHLIRGDSAATTMTFAHTGVVRVHAHVIDYTQLDTLVPGPSARH